MRKFVSLIAFVFLLSFILIACNKDQEAPNKNDDQADAEVEENNGSEIENDYLYKELVHIQDAIYVPSDRNNDIDFRKQLQSVLTNKQPINIVLQGTNMNSSDGDGFADMIGLLSINPDKDSIKVVNISPATLLDIPGRSKDKIKHAYSFGGADLLMETIENNFDVPVHFYMHVNMDFFAKTMDLVESITIDNKSAFSQGDFDFPEGMLELDELDVLGYLRGSKQDSELEMERRQTEVLYAIVQKNVRLSDATKIDNIINVLSDDISTNIDGDSLETIYFDYFDSEKNIDILQLQGKEEIIDGIYYYEVPGEEIERVGTEVREYME